MAKLASCARPLLESYRQRYTELSERMSRAQATASAAAQESRVRSLEHLRAFEGLEERCTELARSLSGGCPK